MNRFSSAALKSSLSIVGVVGAALMAAPAFAENASVSGAMSRLGPAGAASSVAGEIVAPEGMFFNSPLTVGKTYDEGGFDSYIGTYWAENRTEGGLTIDAGAPVPMATAYGEGPAPVTLKQTVINTLDTLEGGLDSEQNLDAYVSILKAAAGVDGLE